MIMVAAYLRNVDMSKKLNPGEVYGGWMVQEDLGYGHRYKCVCTVCGKTTKKIRSYDLIGGKTRMCKNCSSKASRTSHGMSDTSEYNSWVHMIQRCHNPKSKDYPNYGGRGIYVCDYWRDSFEAFYMSVGPKNHPEDTVERLDYNKGYEPGNVVWASRQEQVLNKGDNINLTINGETKTVSQWAQHPDCPVTSGTIYKRINRGWLDEYGSEYTVFSESRKVDSSE